MAAVIGFLQQMLNRHSGKVIRFVIVGFVNTITAYFLYIVLLRMGCNYNVALASDYIFGTILGYVLNSRLTFTGYEHVHGSFLRYLATCVATLLLNGVLLNVIVISSLSGPLLGQALALVLTTMISFLLQMFWVFRRGASFTSDDNKGHDEGNRKC